MTLTFKDDKVIDAQPLSKQLFCQIFLGHFLFSLILQIVYFNLDQGAWFSMIVILSIRIELFVNVTVLLTFSWKSSIVNSGNPSLTRSSLVFCAMSLNLKDNGHYSDNSIRIYNPFPHQQVCLLLRDNPTTCI